MMLALDQSEDIQPMAIEAAVENIRSVAAHRLWTLLMNEAKLLDHLNVMRQFFLLSQGSFYHTLVRLQHFDICIFLPINKKSLFVCLYAFFYLFYKHKTPDRGCSFDDDVTARAKCQVQILNCDVVDM
jgi:hypothetical protein